MSGARHIAVLVLRIYRLAISPVLAALTVPLGMGCRFTPTCSQYALEAVQQHGVVKGSTLALRRLCRCHPWGPWGPDPVPEAGLPFRPCGHRPGGLVETQMDGDPGLPAEASLRPHNL